MTITDIDPKTLRDWLQSGQAVLVDVRDDGEYKSGHIDGSHHIPLGLIDPANLPAYEGRKLVMQCKLGGRSTKACEKLAATGQIPEIHNLKGGIQVWIDAGLPVISG